MKKKFFDDDAARLLVMVVKMIRKIMGAIVGLALFGVVAHAPAATLLDTTQGPDGPINIGVYNQVGSFQSVAMSFTSPTAAIITSIEVHIGGSGVVDVGLLWNTNGTPNGWVPGADYPVTLTSSFLVTLSSLHWSIGAGSYLLAAIPFASTQAGWTTSSTRFGVVPYQSVSGGAWFTDVPPINLPKALITADVIPVPPALPLFATGLGALGLLGWRRKKKAVSSA